MGGCALKRVAVEVPIMVDRTGSAGMHSSSTNFSTRSRVLRARSLTKGRAMAGMR